MGGTGAGLHTWVMASGHSPPAEAANLHSLCIASNNDVSFCLELRFRSNQGNGQGLLWVETGLTATGRFRPPAASAPMHLCREYNGAGEELLLTPTSLIIPRA